jgi:hypothetical protein
MYSTGRKVRRAVVVVPKARRGLYRAAVPLFSRGRTAARTTATQAQAIGDFWSWWRDTGSAAMAASIAHGEPTRMVDELSRRVAAIDPDLAWETAPGLTKAHTLTVTSEGNGELRAVARRWLRAAPEADPAWDFSDTRQPAANLAGASLTMAGRKIDVDSARVSAHVNGFEADVTLYHPAFDDLPAEARTRVTYILLDWALGEVAVETWIGAITPAAVEPLDAFPLTGLGTVVDELARRSVDADGEPVWVPLRGQAADGKPVLAAGQVPLKAVVAPELDTHVRLRVPYSDRSESGLPGPESLAQLRALEDHVTARLEGSGRVVGQVTHDGVRVLHVYVDSGTPAVEQVRAAVGVWTQGEVELQSERDPDWLAVAYLRGA